MKILVLMKRFGANKDMVMQDFGRQIRLFENLSSMHSIDFLCMDYKKGESKKLQRKNIKYYIEPFSIAKINAFLGKLKSLITQNRYEMIVASTSPLLGIIGHFYSRKYGIKFVYDLQDSFDVYDEYKIPFVKILDRHAVKNADIVLCVSETLRKKILEFRKKPVWVVRNGIEGNLFKPINKIKARKKLGLPLNAKIIVHIGLLARIKGYDIMMQAFNKVRLKFPNTYLLLSGAVYKYDKSHVNLRQKNVIFREFPKRKEVVLGINAADVAVLPNPPNNFTIYSFPYKIVEYMACNVPIVATNIGDVSLLLKEFKGSLCEPNPEDMANKIISKFKSKKRENYRRKLGKYEWKKISAEMNGRLVGKELLNK